MTLFGPPGDSNIPCPNEAEFKSGLVRSAPNIFVINGESSCDPPAWPGEKEPLGKTARGRDEVVGGELGEPRRERDEDKGEKLVRGRRVIVQEL